MRRCAWFFAVFALCAGCSRVKVETGAHLGAARTAYLVTKGETPGENDLQMQQAMEACGLTVMSGTDEGNTQSDVLVKYVDRWNWDVEVYLRGLEIKLYDGQSHALLATGTYNDTRIPYTMFVLPLFLVAPSAAADPPRKSSVKQVAQGIIAEALVKLGVPGAKSPSAVPAAAP